MDKTSCTYSKAINVKGCRYLAISPFCRYFIYNHSTNWGWKLSGSGCFSIDRVFMKVGYGPGPEATILP